MSSILKTELLEFYKTKLTVLKSKVLHQRPKVIPYRNYTPFDKREFEKGSLNTISAQKIPSKDFEAFITIVSNSLNKHAPFKK